MSYNTPEAAEAGPSSLADEGPPFKCIVFGCENKSFPTKSALKYIPCNILVHAHAEVVIENTKTSTIVRSNAIRHHVTVKRLQIKAAFNVMSASVMVLKLIPVPSYLANVTKRGLPDRTTSLFIRLNSIISRLPIFQLSTFQGDLWELDIVLASFSMKTVLEN